MKIHLVGGFLGSGKTTAITNASKILTGKKEKTAVITNDQGNFLVDSKFVQISDIPVAEVTGGCFCCNYNQLDSQIDTLKNEVNPSIIFAETVGSCTDLISTVMKPILKFRESDFEQVTFSSFVDSQLLLMFLQGEKLPFKMETNYIWEKQIEEAENLIVNKVDLLSANQLDTLKLLVKDFAPAKRILYQNSLDENSINKWIEAISKTQEIKDHKVIDVDYEKYGAGEANLAWLDEEIEIITTNYSAVEHVKAFIQNLTSKIKEKLLPVGHLKFFLVSNNQSVKISFTTIHHEEIQIPDVIEKANSIDLLVNARIQTSPSELRSMFIEVLNQLKSNNGIIINEKHLSYFQPGFPTPTHKLA